MQPTEATELIQQPLETRRHVDPPHFWWRMVTGSVVAHIIIFAIAYPSLRVAIAQSSGQKGSSVAVDLIDPSEINWSAIAQSGAVQSEVPQTTEQPTESSAPVPAPSQPSSAPAATEFTTPDLTTQAPSIPPSDIPLEENPPLDPQPQSPNPPPETPNEPPPPASAPQPSTPASQPSSSPSDSQGGRGNSGDVNNQLPSQPIGQPPPDVVSPGQGTGSGENSDLPTTAVGGVSVAASFTASLSATSPPSTDARDIPDTPAYPEDSNLEISTNPLDPSSCPFNPGVETSLGTPVEFNLVVEADGTATNVTPVDPSAVDSAYVEFVQCVINKWQFTPATDEGAPRADNLIVTISINRQN